MMYMMILQKLKKNNQKTTKHLLPPIITLMWRISYAFTPAEQLSSMQIGPSLWTFYSSLGKMFQTRKPADFLIHTKLSWYVLEP